MSNRLDPLIQEKLRAFAARRRRLIITRGVFAAIAMLLLTMLVIAAVDMKWVLPDWARWTMSGVAYTAVLVIAWRQCLTWLLHAPDERQLARLVEHAEPKLREDLLSAVELGQGSGEVFDSEKFRELLQQDVAKRMGDVEVRNLLPTALIRKYIGYACCIAAAIVGLGAASGWKFGTLFLRALMPGANLDRISQTKVIIKAPSKGDEMVAHGDTVRVEIELTGERANKAWIETFGEQEGWQQMEMQPTGKDQFAATINVARESVRYRIKAGDALTRKYLLDARERPFVTQFEKIYHYPPYAKQADKTEQHPDGSLIALEGTEVELKLSTNQKIKTGELAIEQGRSSRSVPLTIGSDGRLTARVALNTSGTYRVKLISAETGFENKFAPENELRAILDLPPVVELISPKTDLILSNNELVDIVGQASDDLNLAKVSQLVKVNDGPWKETVLDQNITKKSAINNRWDLYDLRVKAGDLVTTKLVATDIKGAKGESRPLLITVTQAGFELRRLQALASLRDLNATIYALAGAAQDLSDVAKKSREQFHSTENMDPRRQAVVALSGSLAATETKASEAWNSLSIALREAGAGHSSAELVVLGRVLGRLSDVDFKTSKVYADILNVNPGLPGAREMMSEAERGAHGVLSRATYAAGLVEHATFAAEMAVIAENTQVVYREQQRLKDLADASGSDAKKWEPLMSRLRVSLTQVKALEDLLNPEGVRSRGQNGYNAAQAAKNLMKARGKLDQALAASEPSAKLLLGPTAELTNLLRDLSRQFFDWHRDASSRPADSARKIMKDLGPTYGHVSKLVQDLGTLRANKQLPPDVLTDLADSRWQLRGDVIRKHGDVEEIRPAADNLFVSDLRMTTAALESLHAVASGSEPAKLDEKFVSLDSALQILESGHNLQELFDGLNFLATNERWDLRNLSARTQTPLDWKWIASRLEVIPEELNRVRELQQNRARVEAKTPERPQDAAEAEKAVEQARELMAKAQNSNERNALSNEMNQRGVQERVPVTAKADAERLAGQVKLALDLLRKPMQTARQRLAEISPKISEIAASLAKEQEELKKETEEQATKTAEQKPEESKAENQQKLAAQQKLNEKVETLKDLLRAEANKQNILNPEQREAMRDADDSLAMLKDPPPKAEQALQDAANDEQPQQKADLERAMEQQAKLADALKQISEHFEAAEQGKDLAQTRAELRESEKELGVKEELDQQYAHAQMLAEMAQKNSSELLKELEAKLPDNPLMQKELSNITKDALATAEQKLKQANQQESSVAKQLEDQSKLAQQVGQMQSKQELAESAAKAAKEAVEAAKLAKQMADVAEASAQNAGNETAKQQADKAGDQAAEAVKQAEKAAQAAEQLAKTNNPDEAMQQAERAATKAAAAAEAAKQSATAAKEAQATAQQAAQNGQKKPENEHSAVNSEQTAKLAEKAEQAAQKAQAMAQQVAQQMKAPTQDQTAQQNSPQQTANMAAQAAQKAAEAAQAAQKAAENAEAQANTAQNTAAAQQADQAGQQAQKAAQAAQQAADAAKQMESNPQQAAQAAQQAAQKAGEAAQAAEQAANAAQQAEASAKQAAQAGGEKQAENQQSAQQSSEAAQQAKTAANAAKQAQAMAQQAANQAKAASQQNQQLAAAAQQQNAIAQQASEAGAEVERAGRHEMRLGNQQGGEQLQKLGAEVQETAKNEVPAAAEALNKAQNAAQAQGAVNQANTELTQELGALQQAQQGAQQPQGGQPPSPQGQPPSPQGQQPQQTAAAQPSAQQSQPSQGSPSGQQPPSGQAAAAAAQPASAAEQLAMARALDALDQQLNGEQSGQQQAAAQGESGQPAGQGQPPSSNAQASAAQAAMSQAAQAAQASMRQGRAQQGMGQVPGSTVSQSQSEKSEGGAAAQGSPLDYKLGASAQSMKRGDWGKLPKKMADQLTKGQQEAVAGDYRQAVETYYKVIAEKAKQQK